MKTRAKQEKTRRQKKSKIKTKLKTKLERTREKNGKQSEEPISHKLIITKTNLVSTKNM